MGWIVQAYEGEVHVVPDTEDQAHILMVDCWCEPEIDEDGVIVHRDELDRMEIAA